MQYTKILEENLVLSRDGTEVVFKVIRDHQQTEQLRYLSLDLVRRQLKIWSKDLGQFLAPKIHPYSVNTAQMSTDEQRAVQQLQIQRFSQLSMQAYDVRHI